MKNLELMRVSDGFEKENVKVNCELSIVNLTTENSPLSYVAELTIHI